LQCLLSEKLHIISKLQYPKSVMHKTWARQLDEVFELQKLKFEGELASLRTQRSNEVSSKAPLVGRISREWDSYQELDSQCDNLDTTDFIEIGSQVRYERAPLF